MSLLRAADAPRVALEMMADVDPDLTVPEQLAAFAIRALRELTGGQAENLKPAPAAHT